MTGVARRTTRYGAVRTRTIGSDGTGPVVVLLHGFADSADTWVGVVRRLAEAGIPAVAVDLPGFGDADDLAAGPMLPQLDAFVDAVIDAHRTPAGVVIVGNSLGALVALRAACRGAPVLGVMTVSEPAHADSLAIRLFRRPRPHPVVRALGAPLPVPRALSAALLTAAARVALGRSARRNDPVAARRLGDYLAGRGGASWAVRTARRLALESQDCCRFDDLACPVLVVHGQRDRVIPVNGAERIHAEIPHSTLVIEPRWGHCPQLQDPAGVTGLVRSFVRDVVVEPGHRAG